MVSADLRRHRANAKRASNYEYIRDAYVPSIARV
jgi:hypothetical protein